MGTSIMIPPIPAKSAQTAKAAAHYVCQVLHDAIQESHDSQETAVAQAIETATGLSQLIVARDECYRLLARLAALGYNSDEDLREAIKPLAEALKQTFPVPPSK